MIRRPGTSVLVLATVMMVACESMPTTPESAAPTFGQTVASSHGIPAEADHAMSNSGSPFQAWHQGFEHGTGGWYDATSPAPLTWCGSITAVEGRSGAIAPSAGNGYALAEVGGCDPVWGVFEPSGPYSFGAGYSSLWPASGYVMELDVYLDPGWGDDTGFTYAASFRLLASGAFRYFFIPVVKSGGVLTVAGHQIVEAGWYTFRHEFDSGDGELVAVFTLSRRGRSLFSEPLLMTAYSGEATSSFEAASTGSGYIWFDSYPASFFGATFLASPILAIDEHRVRRGS